MTRAHDAQRIGTMEAMVKAQESLDWAGAGALLTDDAVYQAMMLPEITGREAIVEAFQAIPKMRSIKFLMRNVAVNGNIVFFERDDELDIDGEVITVACVGVMEMTGDKINAWREYFDMRIVAETLERQDAKLGI